MACDMTNMTPLGYYSTAFIGSLIGLPVRSLLRNQFSMKLNLPDLANLPVFIVRCGEDFEVGWRLLEAAAQVVRSVSGIWWSRLPNSFRNIVLIDKVQTAVFFLADRCCCLNPWRIRREIPCPEAAAQFLAGNLIYCICDAFLLSFEKVPLGIANRKRLSLAATIRFLEKCIRVCYDINIHAAINLYQEEQRLIVGAKRGRISRRNQWG